MTQNEHQTVVGSRAENVATLTIDNPPVNALSAAVRRALKAALDAAMADPEVAAIVLACAGRTFIAGADISEFGRPVSPPSLGDLIDQIERCPKPVVAALHGTALGGGLEIALACHGRIATASAKLGLPEIKLGLIPGAGGTQRLPRLVGLNKALEMIALGEPVPASEALDIGLIDAIAPADGLDAAAAALARSLAEAGPPLRRISDAPVLEGTENIDRFAAVHARRFRGRDAPQAALRAIQASVDLPFAEGLALERRLFLDLVGGPQSAAQRHGFFAERAARRVDDLAADTPIHAIDRVGIVGAGTMGAGIATAFLDHGVPVTIVDPQPGALDRAVAGMTRGFDAAVAKGRLTGPERDARLARLSVSPALADLAPCDLVIEAAYEEMSVKTAIFVELDRIARPGAILATNTSYLDVDAIAAATSRPEAVIGLHFFSPANLMKLLEVVRGARTAPEVLATALALARRIGKIPVVVGVTHGFVGNRMLGQRQRQAQALILEGAMPWDVDRVLYDFGLPMGPFAMADLAGLDLSWTREASTGATVRDRLCELDRRGQKTGAGFYDYDAARAPTPSPITEALILERSARDGRVRRSIPDDEILERCLYPMINEAARILEEGKAQRASDIDVVWVHGYGWPAWRGGPLYWADGLGLDRVVAGLNRYRDAMPDVSPSPLLLRLAFEGRTFASLSSADDRPGAAHV